MVSAVALRRRNFSFEGHFDRVEVGRVGWEGEEMALDGFDVLADATDLVGLQVLIATPRLGATPPS